jgi:hypothetical protein
MEMARSVVAMVVRSVLISVATSSVMVVTIIRLAKDSEILSSSHEVVQTMSSRVYGGLVSSRLIAICRPNEKRCVYSSKGKAPCKVEEETPCGFEP